MRGHPRTLEEIRLTLEDIASEYAAERVRKASTASAREAEMLRHLAESIEIARLRVLDVSVEVAAYITHCLENDKFTTDEA